MSFKEIISALASAFVENTKSQAIFIEKQVAFGRIILDYIHAVSLSVFNVLLVLAALLSLLFIALSLYSFFTKKKKSTTNLNFKDAPFVTIQIPTRNEIIALRCARKCLEFDYPKNKFEVFIGDDSNLIEVSNEIDEFAKKHSQVHVFRRKDNTGFKPGNLNNMLKHTHGEIIVIFDSDFVPAKDFLKRIVVPFVEDKSVAGVQARWEFINQNKNMVTALAATIVHAFHHVTLDILKVHKSGFLGGSAEAVRKSDLIRLGGWVSGALTEDIEFSLRIHKDKKKIVYLSDLSCLNELPEITSDLYKQQMRWAYGVIVAYKTHFKDIFISTRLTIKEKFLATFGGIGYLIPPMILALTVVGTISIITHRPEPVDWARFFDTTRNILLTSGLLLMSTVSLYHARRIRLIPKMIFASFTIGLLTTYYVNVGIIKAIFNKPMQWFLLNKSTNHTKG